MNAPHLEITTVYASAAASVGRGARLAGVMSLAVATLWMHTLWTRVDPELGVRHNMSMPIALYLSGELTFGSAPVEVANPSPPEGTAPVAHSPDEESDPDAIPGDKTEQMTEARRFVVQLTALMYGWEALATLAGLSLAAAGAAATLGPRVAARWRSVTGTVALLVLAGVGGFVAWIWRSLEGRWELSHVHTLMVLLTLASMSLGAWGSRGGARLQRSAAWLVLLSTAASIGAIVRAHQLGASVERFADPAFLATLGLVQSSYGWLLLLGLRRLR